ncbi:TRAP transporter small permease [Halomonas saccharevitans]|uniref:TRAP transporter small permease protein n=1 Tax=Halomonas saccharevitans TaxID=416872 RepID=A0A1I7CH45_9GAMM|nr:TRAP transporter small permease [Halomonas saccharevitans]SFT98712.1 TRAP-type C4-dicarboxylate transport system, small permease component [Halomonas saccharevitans]
MTYRLRPLYQLGGYLAALCLCLICALITAQVLGRIVDRIATALGGDRIGLAIPGLAEISGFLLVGASFLGLAYTFVHGGHIRVTLLVGRLSPAPRAFVEVFCLSIALILGLYLGWYLYWLLADSIAFNETSYGLLRIPLWIPQSAMLAGVVLLCLALAEAWWATLVIAVTRPATFTIDDSGQE